MRHKVFLSHNSSDKPTVETLAVRLSQESDIEPWLDKWNLIPGQPWQEELEAAIKACDSCVIFIGRGDPQSGVIGPWQNAEMRGLISRQISERGSKFAVIPVLLPGAERGQRSALPTFLVANTWVEFRYTLDEPDALKGLLSGIRGKEPGPPSDARAALAECPYRGLEFFDIEHADRFFGREAVTQWLVDDIRKPLRPGSELPRFLAILGASGSGKSSLARAGLYAALRAGAINCSRDWLFVRPLRPGLNPLESLELAMLQAAAGSPQLEAVRHELRELADKPDRLHRAGRLLTPDASPPRRVFLLVDQFEEVFTTCENEDLRLAFIAALLHAVREHGGPVVVALTMRADFYPKVAAYEELARVFNQHQYLVGPMSEAELRLAIEEPAVRAGTVFEPGLVDTLLGDVHRQPGALALLQHALLELWNKKENGRRLTHAAYVAIGKLAGALERRANEVLAQFSADDQELCRRAFLRLVHPGEGAEDTRRRVERRELLALGDAVRIEKLIKTLAAPDARLVVTEGGDSRQQGGFVEVAHETLIRSWSQLRKWLDADRAGLRTQRRLTEAAREWDEGGRKPDFLYTGARLATAQEWLSKNTDEINAMEQEFLNASEQHMEDAQAEALRKERERADDRERAATRANRQFRIAAGLGLVALASAVTAFLFYARASKDRQTAHYSAGVASKAQAAAERNAILSQSQALVAEVRQLRDTRPVQSLILSAAAVETTWRHLPDKTVLPSAHQTFRDTLTGIGGYPLFGHLKAVTAVAFSPDNRWVVTGSGDKTARLWDLKATDPSAQPVVLKGHEGAITAVAFSPDYRWVVTGSDDNTARLWDLKATDPSAQPVVLKGHEDAINAVAFSPDYRWVVTGSTDKTARLWDLKATDPSAQPVVLKGHEDAINAVAFSPDNRWVVTGSGDKTARLWDLKTTDPSAQPVVLKGHEDAINAVAFSPDYRWVVTGSGDKTARLWDLKATDPSAQPVVLKGHEGPITAVAFSPDNRWVVTGSTDKTARLWDLKATDPSAQPVVLKGHEDAITAVAFSPDNRWVVTGSGDNTARLWDLKATDPSARPVVLKGHEGPITAVAFSPDNRWVVTGSDDKTARLWDLKATDPSAQPVVLKGHEGTIYAVAFSPDYRWVVTGSWDKTARLWDLKATDPSAQPVVLKGHEGPITAVAFSPDYRWVVTGSTDNTARLWDLKATDPSAQPVVLKGHEEAINAVAFSPDYRWVVTGSTDNTARLWDLKATDPSAQPVVLKGHEDAITAVAFSQDNRWVVTGSWDKTARLWDLKATDPSAQPVVLKGHEDAITAVAFSQDNRWVVTGSDDKTARLWHLKATDPSAQPVVLKGYEGTIKAVAFSPDNRWVVTGSWDKTARLWDLKATDPSAQPVVLKGHEGPITAVAFSPNYRWVVTGSGDNTARLWDLKATDPSAQPVVLKGHEGPITAVAFSQDNRWVVTGGEDKTARLWLLQIDDLLALAKRAAGRNLSRSEWQTFLPGQPYFEVFPGLPIPKD